MTEKNRIMQAVEFEGWAVTVRIEGNTQEYALSFLHIFNNVRERAANCTTSKTTTTTA